MPVDASETLGNVVNPYVSAVLGLSVLGKIRNTLWLSENLREPCANHRFSPSALLGLTRRQS